MILAYMGPFANHLWQSTLFAIAVLLIVQTLRKNRAAVRHRLWLVASVKFLVPFSLLSEIGNRFHWETPVTTPAISMFVSTISQPFSAAGLSVVRPGTASAFLSGRLLPVLIGVWVCGIAANLIWWFIRWRQVRQAMRLAAPLSLAWPFRVMQGPARFEPGVFGIFRPVLLLPEGISERLSPAQLQAVLAHELCHVRRRDNLAMALHLIVEALFWFHPLVWLIKVRLIEEQERACDEEVLRLGGDPQVYAESILKVCELYLTSPLVCVSGITGSNLKKRIEDIMKNRIALKLSLSRVLLLAIAATAVVAGPIVTGIRGVKAGGTRAEAAVPSESGLERIPAAPQGRRGNGAEPRPASEIQEYRIGDINVTGAKSIDEARVRSAIGLVSGEIYDESRLRKGFEELKAIYGSRGYVNFVPEPDLEFHDEQKVVDLTINIDEGPQFTVNRISFTGNTTTRDEVLRREIPFKEGDVFDASLLDALRFRLNQLGLFEEIRVEDFLVQPSPLEPKVDIGVSVRETGR
jgi:beta-lactamase regulating signal transducer with metallopeptidase domain